MENLNENEMAARMAENLRNLRGFKTQKQVADALGLTYAAYSYYEAGKRVPRDTIKLKIARYYGQSVDEIFFS